jgi:transcriptional regulator with GAF, ATPase, and Fis domain
MVAVNCGALAPSLLEAQLFGHVRGAFSGAIRDEQGFVRSADGGTLFLDEVGELPKPAQTTLLRVLQEGEVVPVGSTRPVTADVRVISATHTALTGEQATFRPDLFARLAGFVFQLPPLRDRIEDLGIALANMLAIRAPAGGRGMTLAPDLGARLLRHSWPLNFRELQQALYAALALADDGVLKVKHFPALASTRPPLRSAPPAPAEAGEAFSDEEERLRISVIARLREHNGNVAAVARALGKERMQVHRWMRRFGIDPSSFRSKGGV